MKLTRTQLADEHNRLHVWDLTSVGRPTLQRITGFGQPVQYEVLSSPVRASQLIICVLQRIGHFPIAYPCQYWPPRQYECNAHNPQAFIALADGEIKTYDLLCSRISPYAMPNQWRLFENKSLATELSIASEPGS